MDLQKQLDELMRDSFNGQITMSEFEKRVKGYAETYNTLQLQQTGVSGSNLQQYLVRYRKVINAQHALLDDEVVILSKVVEVSNPIEINELIKNIVDIKRIF